MKKGTGRTVARPERQSKKTGRLAPMDLRRRKHAKSCPEPVLPAWSGRPPRQVCCRPPSLNPPMPARPVPPSGCILLASLLLSVACSGPAAPTPGSADDSHGRLPTGARLDPAAPLLEVGPMPLTMVSAPEPDRVVLLLNGWRDEGIQVVERSSGRVLQTVRLPAVFIGIAFAPD